MTSIVDAPAHLPMSEPQPLRLSSPTRLAALRATGLLDGTANPVLDRLTRIVTRLLAVPIALVSLVDDQRQHFAGLTVPGGRAVAERGAPLSLSFCQHVVRTDDRLLVSDASTHPLVRGNLARTELGVVAYAGVPLRNAEGETLGALCAIDTMPVNWTSEQIEALEDLAAAAMAEIELRVTVSALAKAYERLRQQAMRDPLTGLLNRRGFMEIAKQQVALAERQGMPFMLALLDLDGFKQINDTLGHDAGDEALVEVAAVLSDICRTSDIVGRHGGDEFIWLLTNADISDCRLLESRLAAALIKCNGASDREFRLAASIGFSASTPELPQTLPTMLRLADEAMFGAKRRRKSRITEAA